MKFYLKKIRINSQGYDSDGHYWGVGETLYQYFDVDENIISFLRARDRSHAQWQIKSIYKDAEFFDNAIQ